MFEFCVYSTVKDQCCTWQIIRGMMATHQPAALDIDFDIGHGVSTHGS